MSKSNKLVGEPFSFFDRAVALRRIEQLGQCMLSAINSPDSRRAEAHTLSRRKDCFIAVPISEPLSQKKFDLATDCGDFLRRRLAVARVGDLYQVSSGQMLGGIAKDLLSSSALVAC
jgi:hypothetical protein